MSLLAALAKGLGAGTLQNSQDGFNEQTRQKEEIRRQAEIREQISASKDESTREWQKRDEQLNKQIAAGKEDLNTRLTFEREEAKKQREYDRAKYEASLKATLTEAMTKGTYDAEKSAANNLIDAVKFIETSKQKIMDSDTITPEQKKEKMAQWDLIGAMTTQTPYAHDLLIKHGGGAYVDLYASMMPSQSQPQQGGEPTSGADPQPTTAPGRPGESGGGVKLAGAWQPSVPDGYQSAIPQPKAFTGGGAPQPQGYQQPGGRTFFGDDLPDAYSTATGIISRIREQQSTGPSPQQAAAMAWSTPHR